MKYTFLILSNQPFDFELKTNKWHVAKILSERGHEVVFIDPPLRFKALKSLFKQGGQKINRPKNLTVYKPINLFNFFPFSIINTWFHTLVIKRLLRSDRKLVVWVYHFDFPDLRNFLKRFEYDLLIYDVVDEYTAFPEYINRKRVNPSIISWIQWFDDELKIRLNQKGLQGKDWVLNQEKWLSDNANLMFASAPGLVEKFNKWRKEVYYLPNAAAVDKFNIPSKTLEEPEDLKSIPHPRIGFTGAIDTYKTDLDLVEKCAKTYPNYHFIMIGPEKVADPDLDLSALKSMDNVHFLGMKPWEETPKYFNHFDAYFIPYHLEGYGSGGFPVKYFEALSAGLPTIVTYLPAYKGFDPDGYVSNTAVEFIDNIKKGLDEDSQEKRQSRIDLAKQNSWDGKVDKQLALINEYFRKN